MRRGDRIRTLGVLVALGLCAISFACAKSPPKAAEPPVTEAPDRAGPFPSREEVSRLGQSPPAHHVLEVPMRDVDSWRLTGDFPQRIELASYAPASPWEALLAEQTWGREGTLYPSAAMRCVAREYGRFYSVHGVRPTERLLQYMGGACGTIAQDITPMVLHATAPEGVSDDDLFVHWKDEVARRLASIQGSPRSVGLAFARDKDRAVVAVVHGEIRVELRPLVPVPDEGGRVFIEGLLLLPAERIHAMINRGRFGFAECALDPAIPLPRFAIRCEMSETDDLGWIQVSFLPPGRILSRPALQVLARVRGATVDMYQRHLYTASDKAATPAEFTTKLMHGVNGVRKQAKLPPLALAARQSEIAARLAPRFFAAAMGTGDPLDADRIVLGMIAGWDVEGTVRDGGFSATMIGETRDVSRWLSTALEFPGGRQALLSPDTVLLAIGPLLIEQNQLLGAIVGSYSLFGDDHAADEAAIFDLIARHRAGLGMSVPTRVDALDAHIQAAGQKIRSRAATPINTLNELLQVSARALQRSVNGFVLDTSRLEDFRLPEDLLRRRALEVAITVTHYQPPGEPWGRYVILVVVPAPLPSV